VVKISGSQFCPFHLRQLIVVDDRVVEVVAKHECLSDVEGQPSHWDVILRAVVGDLPLERW
jgi:hypothetical protein